MPGPLDAPSPRTAGAESPRLTAESPLASLLNQQTAFTPSSSSRHLLHTSPQPFFPTTLSSWLLSAVLAVGSRHLAPRCASGDDNGSQRNEHALGRGPHRWRRVSPSTCRRQNTWVSLLLVTVLYLVHRGAAVAALSSSSGGGKHDLFQGFLPPWPPPGLRSIQIVMKGMDTYDTVLWSSLVKDLRMVQAVSLPNMAQKVVLRAFVDEPMIASLKIETGGMVQGTRFPKDLREQLQQAQASRGNASPIKVYQSSSMSLSTMAVKPLVLRFTAKVPPGGQPTLYSMFMQLSRRLDCSKKQDCASRLCVRGKCVCPALVNANTDCTAGVLRDDWCLMPMQKLNTADVMRVGQNQTIVDRSATRRFRRYSKYLRMDHFTVNRGNTHAIGMLKDEPQNIPDSDIMDYADFSTCAVVGSSSVMTQPGNKARGAEIDAHSAVIRFNEAPVKGYEKFVGSKTTLRIQNPERAGFAERKGELCIYKMGRSRQLPADSLCHFFENSPQFEAYYRVLWALYRPEGAELERPKMSSGFMGVALAVHLCAKVDLYGFTHSDGYYFNKLPFRDEPSSPGSGRDSPDSDDSSTDGDVVPIDYVAGAPVGHPSHPLPQSDKAHSNDKGHNDKAHSDKTRGDKAAISPAPRGGGNAGGGSAAANHAAAPPRNARGPSRPARPAGRKLKLIENLEDRHPWRYERLCTQKMAAMGVVRVV